MRRLIVLGLVLVSTTSIAQSDSISDFNLLDKSNNIVGLTFSGGWGGGLIVGTVNLRYGRFVMKKLNGGLDVEISSNGTYYKKIGVGPFIRYYFLDKIFSPVIEVNYHLIFLRYGTSNVQSQIYNDLRIGGGIAFNGLIKKKVGIEFLGEYRIKNEYRYVKNDILPVIRFIYHF